MNKIRIIGLIMLIIGVILPLSFENDGTDMLSGFVLGAGIVLLITGKFKVRKEK